jgi:hypothetical protein
MCCPSTEITPRTVSKNDNHSNRPFSKHVHFQLEVDVAKSSSPLDAFETAEEWKSMWYEFSDLEAFRQEARILCKKLDIAASPGKPSLALDENTRGLEQRCCYERQRRKYLSSRYILRASTQCEPERLAAVSRKCTAYAADLAVEEAARDYNRAWSEEIGLKRTLDTENSRRVRARTISVVS